MALVLMFFCLTAFSNSNVDRVIDDGEVTSSALEVWASFEGGLSSLSDEEKSHLIEKISNLQTMLIEDHAFELDQIEMTLGL